MWAFGTVWSHACSSHSKATVATALPGLCSASCRFSAAANASRLAADFSAAAGDGSKLMLHQTQSCTVDRGGYIHYTHLLLSHSTLWLLNKSLSY